MPNQLTALGLETATQSELLLYYTAIFQLIYGDDIDLSSDSPDGQWINILIQNVLDIEDLLTQIYNSFDPDNATGVVLDQRVAINGIQRKGGTYTVTNITLVLSQALTLYGLDQSDQPIYTISDNVGNDWELVSTQAFPSDGTYTAQFQSSVPGEVVTIPNTITVPISIVLGVTSVNNPTTYSTLGTNEESDMQLKIRRQQSVSLSGQGYYDALLAALLNISGVTFANILENDTGSTDSNGVPGHSIWVIVAGTGSDSDIGNAIYQKRNAGCGMKGTQTFGVTQPNGTIFTVSWDDVIEMEIIIYFTATSLDGTTLPRLTNIIDGLPLSFIPGVAAQVNVNELSTLVQAIDPNTLVTGAGFSTGLSQIITFSAVAASGAFKLSYGGNSTASINWNDNAATIQTRLRSLAGLSAVTVAGSISSQTVTVTMTGVTDPSLIGYNTNTLLTAGSAVVSLAFFSNYTTTLTPTTKQEQFVVTSAKIVIIPIVVIPAALTIVHSTSEQFSAQGGYGTYIWSLAVNNSGGSINSSSGLYSAGATPSSDTVRVTDGLQNHTDCVVTVT